MSNFANMARPLERLNATHRFCTYPGLVNLGFLYCRLSLWIIKEKNTSILAFEICYFDNPSYIVRCRWYRKLACYKRVTITDKWGYILRRDRSEKWWRRGNVHLWGRTIKNWLLLLVTCVTLRTENRNYFSESAWSWYTQSPFRVIICFDGSSNGCEPFPRIWMVAHV